MNQSIMIRREDLQDAAATLFINNGGAEAHTLVLKDGHRTLGELELHDVVEMLWACLEAQE